ncbi:alcohol acetyltransferase [Aspergillus karnatakaensis]|uniref:uncharacterized protein n=1 Tax=Aspergillus karnatakaensis TaxID=1810916 RepID=UPI003CCE3E53
MAVNTGEFERLRDLGSLEKCFTASHSRRFYFNAGLTATYTLPQSYSLPLKDYVYKAVEALINQHPALSAIALDEDTEDPYLVRLPSIDLDQPISFQKLSPEDHDTQLQALLEHEHYTGFQAPQPFWRLIILTTHEDARNFTATFVYHHSLLDGNSGSAFHRTFLKALRAAATLQPGEAKQIITPPKSDLLPALETILPLPLSLPYLTKELLKALLPLKPNPKLWAGAKIQPPQKVRARLVTFTAEQTAQLAKVCRAHGTTVTCTLATIIARCLFAIIPEHYTTLTFSIPMSNRQWFSPDLGINDDSMGVWVQECLDKFHRKAFTGRGKETDDFPWSEAQRARRVVKHELALKGKNTTMGLLKYVKSYGKEFLDGRMGKPRQLSFEMSSLGVVKVESEKAKQGQDEEQKETVEVPQMHRAVFSQTAGVTGCAVQFSVATGPNGCLVLGVTWREGVVEDDFVDTLLERARKEVEGLL